MNIMKWNSARQEACVVISVYMFPLQTPSRRSSMKVRSQFDFFGKSSFFLLTKNFWCSWFCTLWNVQKIKIDVVFYFHSLVIFSDSKMRQNETWTCWHSFFSQRTSVCVRQYLWCVVVCVCVREAVSVNSSWRSLCCSWSSQVKVFTFVLSCLFLILFLHSSFELC